MSSESRNKSSKDLSELIDKDLSELIDVGFKDFCNQTSLHGWGFMTFGQFKTLPTLFWLTAILSTSVLCTHLVIRNVNEFMGSVEFNVESLTADLDEIYFPSLYIINTGTMRKSNLMHTVFPRVKVALEH